MNVYQTIFRTLADIKDAINSELPVSIEVNKETHKELTDDIKKLTKNDNILSIETLFHLPIFINDKMNDGEVQIKTNKGNIDICVNCVHEYTSAKKPEILVYNEENQCEICRHVCKTTKLSTSYVDFIKIKNNKKPNI